MIRIDLPKRDDIPFEVLYPIMLEAFKERADQGLDFACLQWTFEEFKSKLKNDNILIAREENGDGDVVIGFERLVFHDNHVGCGLIAVLPDYKRHGVGRALFNAAESFAKSRNFAYLTACTAVGANSSIKWHVKNGFKIIGLESYPNTNYYSYLFRKQLKYHILWNNNLYCMIRRLLSTIECKTKYQENGEYTKFLKIYIKSLDSMRSFLNKK